MQRLCDWVKRRSMSVSYIYIYIHDWNRLFVFVERYSHIKFINAIHRKTQRIYSL